MRWATSISLLQLQSILQPFSWWQCNHSPGGSATILLVALLFNALFHWRRYPAFLLSKENEKDYTNSGYAPVDHADFVYALSQMGTFIDVTEDDLLKIYQLANWKRNKLK